MLTSTSPLPALPGVRHPPSAQTEGKEGGEIRAALSHTMGQLPSGLNGWPIYFLLLRLLKVVGDGSQSGRVLHEDCGGRSERSLSRG